VAQQPKVFVSHSHKDDDFTQRLVSDLHQAGAEVWVDVSGITYGNFMQRIDEALQQCQWMVVVLTPNAIASPYVRDEVYVALHRVNQGYMQGVIPLLASPCAPDSIPPQWDVLQRYNATQDYASAVAGLLRAVGLSRTATTHTPPESVDHLLTRGQALVAQEQYAEALHLFERAVQHEPGSFYAWANLGHIFGELSRWQESLTACDRALALDGSSSAVWNNKGLTLNHLNRFDEALTALDRALALDPNDAGAWYNKGNALSRLKRYDEALATYDRALALDPNFAYAAYAWNNKADALNSLRRYAEARTAIDRALELDPESALAWCTKGEIQNAQARVSSALNCFERSLAFDPEHADAWYGKSLALRTLGGTAEADAAEQRAKELGWKG
jgi:tetratricopeptide (TPR) repeat protein